MATVQLQPPQPFNLKSPDEWPRWRKRFEQFRIASGLSSEDDERQVSTLLYLLGSDAEDVLTSTGIATVDRKKYDNVVSSFDNFFKVRRNTIFERARFNRRNQLEGETAEEYIAALYTLAETCEYDAFKDEMIRDRLVVGIRDSALSERLQMDAELTLERAKKLIRQREAVRGQQQFLRADASTKEVHGNVDFVRTRKFSRPNAREARKCTRCGGGQHGRDACPAKDAVCHRCRRKGHFKNQCFSRDVRELTGEDATGERENALDAAFLGAVNSDDAKAWTETVLLNGVETVFKLDTGAEVTAVSEATYKKLKFGTLTKPTKALYGPARQSLHPLGQFVGSLSHKQSSSDQVIFVIKNLQTNLLGLPAITALNLAARVDTISLTSDAEVHARFPKLFQGLGNLGEEYTIRLKPGAKPHALYTPRRVALPLCSKVKEELDRMEALGVTSKVSEPTAWCAGMVPVPKKDGSMRICVDLKPLNECVLRETHPLPKVDNLLAQLSGATCFSKLDANSGFWQIPLASESRRLTTFITPYGRFCFNKLPFGISSAPEHFQRRMNTILEGLQGVVCLVDDVLVYGSTPENHDVHLHAALKRIETAGVTLNQEKCVFRKTQLRFLGHIIDKSGVMADPEKTSAIAKMNAPCSVPELRRFLGMTNQLGKFVPHLAQLTQPLRELLGKKSVWLWGDPQEAAFRRVKEELVKPTVLALYDLERETKISADASSHGLGAVLLQKFDSEWRPVAFASRSMTDTERRYAQIEKEALATTWACERFSDYILGRHCEIETDHKPLVPLLSSKNLDDLPPRILRFRLRLNRFQYSIQHVPGKYMYTADTLSRAPSVETSDDHVSLQGEVETFVAAVAANLPASAERLEAYRISQTRDATCSQVVKFCQSEWPAKQRISTELKPYWEVREHLTVCNGLLMYDNRIVVPESLRRETLQKVHEGHQGIQRCRLRVQSSVWWPGVSKEVKQLVLQCPTCQKDSSPPSEPMLASELPAFPWQRVGSDLLELDGVKHIVIVDYYSRYPEVVRLSTSTSASIIQAFKSVFSRHGIPETLVSDNGPQFVSQEFRQFADKYGFHQVTTSPHYPQANGQAERTVQTVKQLLRRSEDPYMALMTYRATPLPWCKLSPTELLMGRKIRTTLPQVRDHFKPQWPYLDEFERCNLVFKENQQRTYDRQHRVRELPDIPENTEVWVNTKGHQIRGQVTAPAGTPRSYLVDTPSGLLRRNRHHLIVIPNSSPATSVNVPASPGANARDPDSLRDTVQTRTKTGTAIRPPERWDPSFT